MDIIFAGIGVVSGGIGVALIIISERWFQRQAEADVRRTLFPIWEFLRHQRDGDDGR